MFLHISICGSGRLPKRIEGARPATVMSSRVTRANHQQLILTKFTHTVRTHTHTPHTHSVRTHTCNLHTTQQQHTQCTHTHTTQTQCAHTHIHHIHIVRTHTHTSHTHTPQCARTHTHRVKYEDIFKFSPFLISMETKAYHHVQWIRPGKLLGAHKFSSAPPVEKNT